MYTKITGYFQVLSYDENLYMFINNQFDVNSGIGRCLVQDLHGNFLDLYSGSDEVNMEVNYQDNVTKSPMWYNVTNAVNNNEFKVNISMQNDRDIGNNKLCLLSKDRPDSNKGQGSRSTSACRITDSSVITNCVY